jgi:hypothetical protein
MLQSADSRARFRGGILHLQTQLLVERASQAFVGLGNQSRAARKMMVDQADRNAGSGADAPHRNAFVTVFL